MITYDRGTSFLLMLACWFCSCACRILAHIGNWLLNLESLRIGFANYSTLSWRSFLTGIKH